MKTYGIYSGGFKPPHKGHWDAILKASEMCQEVVVMVSASDRNRPGEIRVYGKRLIDVWHSILSRLMPKNVVVEYSPNPITSAMALIDLFNDRMSMGYDPTLVRIFGDKDDLAKSYGDFSKLTKITDKLVAGNCIELVPTERTCSGTEVRAAVARGERELVYKEYFPSSWTDVTKKQVYDAIDPVNDFTGRLVRPNKYKVSKFNYGSMRLANFDGSPVPLGGLSKGLTEYVYFNRIPEDTVMLYVKPIFSNGWGNPELALVYWDENYYTTMLDYLIPIVDGEDSIDS